MTLRQENLRQKLSELTAEFIGTALLATIAIAAASYFRFTAPWYVSLSVGAALAVIVATIGRVSGAHVNPAVTIGLWTLKKITTVQALTYISVQLLAGACVLLFVEYVTNTDIIVGGAGSFDLRIFTAEAVGAAVFGFGIAAAILQKLDPMHSSLTIGASLTLGILVASLAAPGYLNPSVALANNAWDRTVVIAPVVGIIIGMNLYKVLFSSTSPNVAPVTMKPAKKKIKSRK